MKKIESYDVIIEGKSSSFPIKILIVDDLVFVRKYLAEIIALDKNFQLIGKANNGKDAIQKVASLEPDVILIDLEMPKMNGITATQIIALEHPRCKILVLSSYQDSEHLQKAIHAGANGYLIKDSSPQEITNAIYTVARGHSQLSPGLLEKVLTPKVEVIPERKRIKKTRLNSSKKNLSKTDLTKYNTSLGIILKFLIGAIALTIPLMILIKVDRTVAVSGELATEDKITTIDAPDRGKIVSLEAEEGTIVKKGETLIRLDAPLVSSQLKQYQEQLVAAENQLANLNLAKKQQQLAISTQRQENKAQELEKQLLIEELQDDLDTLKSRYSNQISEQYLQLETAKKVIEEAILNQKILQIRQEAAKEKAKQYQEAYQDNTIGKQLFLEAKQTVKQNKTDLERAENAIAIATKTYQEKQDSYYQKQQQLNANIEQATLKLQEQQSSYQSLIKTNNANIFEGQKTLNNLDYQIKTLIAEINQNNSLIEDLKLQLERRTIYSPINGVIFQLAVTEIGSTIKSGQVIAKIIPEESSLIFQGKIQDRQKVNDLLKVGLPVKLKFDAYPFPNYGILSGRLTKISSNSIKPSNSNREATRIQGDLVEDKVLRDDKNNIYEIQVKLDRNYLKTKERQILLTPGQSATAEIIIGKHRLIEIFLKPFRD